MNSVLSHFKDELDKEKFAIFLFYFHAVFFMNSEYSQSIEVIAHKRFTIGFFLWGVGFKKMFRDHRYPRLAL